MAVESAQQTNNTLTPSTLRPVAGVGWLAGFGNLFNKEMGDWFSTRRWLIQSILWIALVGGFVAFVLFAVPAIDRAAVEAARAQGQNVPSPAPFDPIIEGLAVFFSIGGLAGSIGVIILSQDELVGEKQSGTLAWILSKPISRPAILFAKLVANAIGVFIFVLLLPAIVSYLEIGLANNGVFPDLLPFLAGLPLLALTFLFYLCLSIMLGVLFNQRAALLGIMFGVLFGGSVVPTFVPDVNYVLPNNLSGVGNMIALGQTVPQESLWPILATAVWCVVFIAVALWRFQRQEI